MTVPADAPTAVSMTYDGSTTSEVIKPSSSFTDWDTYFGNTNPTKCPINSCTVYDSVSSTAISDPISISLNTVTAMKNVIAGYTQSIYIICTNGA